MVKKSKGVQWFSLIGPKVFGSRELGKTFVSDPGRLIGRRISLSIIELTNDFEKYYMKFTFKVKKIEADKAFVDFDGSEVMRDYLSRMILRRIRRIDSVQDVETKDMVKIRVKGLAIIPRRIKSSIQKKIRNNIKDILKKEVQNLTLDDFIKGLMSDEIKNKVLKEARRIYPVRNFEIRKTEIISK